MARRKRITDVSTTITDHCLWNYGVGRGCRLGWGRGCGVGRGRGVGVHLPMHGVAVGVALGVGVGVGVGRRAQHGTAATRCGGTLELVNASTNVPVIASHMLTRGSGSLPSSFCSA